MDRVRSIEVPPKVDPETLFAKTEGLANTLLRALYAGLLQLHQETWIDDDFYDGLLTVWRDVTGVSFRDTVPVYHVEVDGKVQTFGDVLAQRDRVQEATDKMREEGKI